MVLFAASCSSSGSSSPEDEINATFDSFVSSMQDGDWEQFCSVLAPEAQRGIAATSSDDSAGAKGDTACIKVMESVAPSFAESLKDSISDSASIGSIVISENGETATAVVTSKGEKGEDLAFTLIDGKWKIEPSMRVKTLPNGSEHKIQEINLNSYLKEGYGEGSPDIPNIVLLIEGKTVTFRPSSVEPEDLIMWDFGDGRVSFTKGKEEVVHEYLPGSYVPTLAVENQNGDKSFETLPVILNVTEDKKTQAIVIPKRDR